MTQALPNNQSLVQIWLQKKYAIFLKKFLTQAGIVRRIDDLGRVVIPKEIRKTLRIREGDPLLTTLTQCRNADKHGVCEESSVPEKENRALAEERIGQIKRELFVGGMIGLAERTGKS